MSAKTILEFSVGRRLCSECKQRLSLFSVRGGAVKSDDDHDLCFRCWRALKNSIAAANLRDSAASVGGQQSTVCRFGGSR